jgi:hypothetical protein
MTESTFTSQTIEICGSGQDRKVTTFRKSYGSSAAVFIVAARKGEPNCLNYDLGIIAEPVALAAQDFGVQSAILGMVGFCPAAVLQQTLELSDRSAIIAVGLGYATPGWNPPPTELVSPVKWLEQTSQLFHVV